MSTCINIVFYFFIFYFSFDISLLFWSFLLLGQYIFIRNILCFSLVIFMNICNVSGKEMFCCFKKDCCSIPSSMQVYN